MIKKNDQLLQGVVPNATSCEYSMLSCVHVKSTDSAQSNWFK